MSYTHTSFLQLKTALANRLGDAGNVQWSDAENGLYIVEALRTWGLATGYWRDRGTFNTVAGTGFYDISTLKNGLLTDLLSYTVTDTQLGALIQYHLLEPATGSSWTGSEQFTLSDVAGALTRRRDLFLEQTGAVLGQFTQVLPAGSQTFDLPDTTVEIRNLRWTSSGGVDYPILPEDVNKQRNYGQDYLLVPGTPQTYSSSSVKELGYVLAPPSSQPGTLRVTAIQSGATLTTAGVLIGIPDDMAWVIKWGALADLLGREGPGQDLTRSYFCERKWKLGVALALIAPTVINSQINGISLSLDTLSQIDQYSPNWYSSTGTPTLISNLRNIVGLAPCPNGIYSVTLDVVSKAVVPVANGDFIQIGREYLDAILDYAEHLAAFKSGGVELRHTFRCAENFFNAALSYNQRLAAQHPAIIDLIKQSTNEDSVQPMKKPTQSTVLQSASQMANQ